MLALEGTELYRMGEEQQNLIGTLMNELDRIREQIKRMRHKGIEPEVVYMCHELWDKLGRPRVFFGVECCENERILGRFEVR